MKKKIFKIAALFICICILFTGCESIGTFLGLEGNGIEFAIENGEAAIVGVPNKSTITEIVIPDEYEGVPVTKIADFSIANLEYVTTVYIGKNVKEIGAWAISNNHHITEFKVDEANEYFCDIDGVLFTKDMKTLLFYPIAKDLVTEKDANGNEVQVSTYKIPDGVETIRSKAFYKCYPLKELEMPDTIKVIEEKAFFRCERLGNFKMSQSIETIGKDAFSYCYGLTEMSIFNSIKQIDTYAFYNCENLLTINVDAVESNLTLGDKWYPTKNGLAIKDLTINWQK